MAIYTGLLADVTFPVNGCNTGFNLVSVSDLGWDGDDNNCGYAGTATVKAVCFNIQEIPDMIKEAESELSYRSSGACINPVCFRIEHTHPWFEKLTPQDYNWRYVEVVVEDVNFLSQSEDYPGGIYSKEIAEMLIEATTKRFTQAERFV